MRAARLLEGVVLSWPRLLTRLAVGVAMGLLASALHAEPAPSQLAEAKELFRRGVALLATGDTERALEQFLRSRELVPSGKNTVNAAICLERLKRSDEALELYEEVLARFPADLNQEDRENLAPVMAALRGQIGYLELSANVDGLVTIAGRPRGRLPFRTALRVLPGRQTLRIVKDGYKAFSVELDVQVGTTRTLDAELEPLANLGALRIESLNHGALDVFVDGTRLGATPWEGTLAAGRHVLYLERDGFGSAPQAIQVLGGRTELLRLPARRLGPRLSLSATPPTASLDLAGVPLGHGSFQGRLPIGDYRFTVSEEGYFAQTVHVRISESDSPALAVKLLRNPDHARWPKQRIWAFEVGARLGASYAPRTGAGLESSCPDHCAGSKAALGALGALSFGVRHPSGFGAWLSGGFRAERQRVSRAAFVPFENGRVTYALDERVGSGGPFLLAQASFNRSVARDLSLLAMAGGGIWLVTRTLEYSGVAFSNGPTENLRGSAVPAVTDPAPLIALSLGVERRVGRFRFAALLEADFFPVAGSRFAGPLLSAAGDCPDSPGASVACAPISRVFAGEPSSGRHFSMSPTLGAGFSF